MKYSININQKAIVELNNEAGANLDLKDATIISFFKDYTHFPKVQKQIIENEVFYWVSYQWIIDENPLLEIENKNVLARRIEKICNAGILQKFIDKKQGNKIYLAFGKNYQRLITDTPIYSKVDNLSTQKSEPLSTQKSYNYNTDILGNKKIENKEIEKSIIDNQVDQKDLNNQERLNINSLSNFFGLSQEEKEDMDIFRSLNTLILFLSGKGLVVEDLEKIKTNLKQEEFTKNRFSKKHWGGWINDYQTQKTEEKLKQFTITKDPNYGKTGISYSYYLYHWNKGEIPEETTQEFLSNYFFN